MSEEETHGKKENEENNHGKQVEDTETGNETLSSSNRSDLSQNLNHDLQHFVVGGIEIQPQDILVIEDLPTEYNGKSSDEDIAGSVFCDFLTEFDDKNSSDLQSYFHDTVNSPTNKNLPQFDEIQRQNVLDKQMDKTMECLTERNQETIAFKNDTGSTKRSEYIKNMNTENELKVERIPSLEMQRIRWEDQRDPCLPIIDFAMSPDSINKLKFSDCASDEFADIEDNAKDSSSDNNDCPFTFATTPLKGLFSNVKHNQTQIADERKFFNGDVTSSSSSENYAVADKCCDNNFASTSYNNSDFSGSYFSQISCMDIKKVQAVKMPNEGKKMFKISMSTIVEAPEGEDDGKSSQNNQLSHSKPNNLKMKAVVGNRKDKCNICNVRLGLTAFKCRCDGYYCAKHRYDKEHGCSFDYKTMGANEIRKNNPKVVAEKIRKL